MGRSKRSPEKHWSATLKVAHRLIAARETHAARVALERLISFVDQTWGAEDVHLIRPLRLMATSHFFEHEPLDPNNEAEVECLRRALGIARLRLGNDHLEVARLAGKIGNALVIAGSIDDGCALMGECLEIAKRLGKFDEFSRYLCLIGDGRMAQGRPQEALGFFEQYVSVCERDSSLSRLVDIARYTLGKCLRQLGRPKDALVELELALGIARSRRSDWAFIVTVENEIKLAASELL